MSFREDVDSYVFYLNASRPRSYGDNSHWESIQLPQVVLACGEERLRRELENGFNHNMDHQTAAYVSSLPSAAALAHFVAAQQAAAAAVGQQASSSSPLPTQGTPPHPLPSSSTSPPAPSGTPQVSLILTIRLLMQGKEVGSIIGKRGDHIKLIREESGAKINISDGSCPERIVTITGNAATINKAFAMICNKFHEDMKALPNSVPKPPITMRMIVPATQCGSLIGKGGSKIKEIREATGASIQVASEMLPSSTERAVTLSGTHEAIALCMTHICQILLEAPPKGATLPYRPKPSFNPLLIASSAAAAAAQQQAVAALLQPYQTTPQLLTQDLAGRVSGAGGAFAAGTAAFLPTVPSPLNPQQTVYSNGLMEQSAALKWGLEEKQQLELMQGLAPAYLLNTSMLLGPGVGAGAAVQPAPPASSSSSGPHCNKLVVQSSASNRYTPY